jgi:hypothetical protein
MELLNERQTFTATLISRDYVYVSRKCLRERKHYRHKFYLDGYGIYLYYTGVSWIRTNKNKVAKFRATPIRITDNYVRVIRPRSIK